MKAIRILSLFPFLGCVASAATVVNFDSGPDPSLYSFERFGAFPAPSVSATGGNPGGFLQITREFGDQHNFVTFNQTDIGTFPVSTFSFDIRIDRLGNGGADGVSFAYLDTAIYGASGPLGRAPYGVAEDPAGPGVLGFGFDTWGNGGSFDANDLAANYSEISLFYNANLISRVDDTRALLPTGFDLKDSAWHTVVGRIDFAAAKVSLTFDGIPIFENVDVPDLVPFESRLIFGGRTGGANERASVDNLNVQYVPEPGTAALLALGGGLLLRRSRRS